MEITRLRDIDLYLILYFEISLDLQNSGQKQTNKTKHQNSCKPFFQISQDNIFKKTLQLSVMKLILIQYYFLIQRLAHFFWLNIFGFVGIRVVVQEEL